ncbi:MAG: type VI secretion system ImpA family N-terminal domain-containing protein [Rubellimicrobium sp.]|nr:type VI secretion system ImpA family N-terminal domain-containing protein [Rubellimicrobium sp.]
MSLDWLTEPVDPDQPCGPDLSLADDPAFLDYYFEAEARMPERYFTPGLKSDNDPFTPGTLFDPRTIQPAREKEAVVALLRRSRDLRLLSLLARFQILAGRLEGFVEAVEGMAELIHAFPDAAHPQDAQERRGAIEELANVVLVIAPLQYLSLDAAGEATLRRHLAATGQSEKRAGEVELRPETITGVLSTPPNKAAVERNHALLTRAAQALDRIMKGCLLNGERPFTPAIRPALDTIRQMQELIAEARSDLWPWTGNETAGDDAPDAAAAPEDSPAAGEGGPLADSPVAMAPLPRTAIPDRATAAAALVAIEAYFARHEPASAALLLVTQARLLVGKSLVEAIELLLPEAAPRAAVSFGPNGAFVLNMERLRMLSKAGGAGAGQNAAAEMPDPVPSSGPPAAGIEIADRREAAANLAGVEEFFRIREPASPIPMLLALARSYLDKDFSAIVSAIVPAP